MRVDSQGDFVVSVLRFASSLRIINDLAAITRAFAPLSCVQTSFPFLPFLSISFPPLSINFLSYAFLQSAFLYAFLQPPLTCTTLTSWSCVMVFPIVVLEILYCTKSFYSVHACTHACRHARAHARMHERTHACTHACTHALRRRMHYASSDR